MFILLRSIITYIFPDSYFYLVLNVKCRTSINKPNVEPKRDLYEISYVQFLLHSKSFHDFTWQKKCVFGQVLFLSACMCLLKFSFF